MAIRKRPDFTDPDLGGFRTSAPSSDPYETGARRDARAERFRVKNANARVAKASAITNKQNLRLVNRSSGVAQSRRLGAAQGPQNRKTVKRATLTNVQRKKLRTVKPLGARTATAGRPLGISA